MERIYLDHAATSPVHPAVLDKMTTFMKDYFGNPSSIHSFGRESRREVDEARELLAKSIHADPKEIIFTSGGTEADNLAVIGTALANKEKGNHIITTEIEHPAVLQSCRYLEKNGFHVTYLPVNQSGVISVDDLKKALKDETILVTVMYGNNEVGALQPISEIGSLLQNHQAYFHTDAVQAYGLVPIDVRELNVDLLSVSGHKINGPKGIGFLYAKAGVKFTPRMHGGEQELKRRAGTENVPAIIGFAESAKIAEQTRKEKTEQYVHFKQIMIDVFEQEGISFAVNGSIDNSLPHILNVFFPGTNVESLLVNLDLAGIAASSGSACTAGSVEPSHVLVSMFGKNSKEITSSVRFSFGLGNTEAQIESAAKKTAEIVKRLTSK
ncbi:cysteine desulfurase NifS [Bacillaceae bacterium ZC4]|uniref:cysteine desulfurase n=1 Tax=Aeribacillus composti TaxID=1868734 RepID=A0ABY9WAU7_9BACI|nr:MULTISPECIES: cysteine desulfurase family protein [Aeribacillus]AXI40193.1 cysteine desulfurase NifS [Bacillaceae bacterium ZC4]REJ25258.1 MAG: cysteine desulfurase NifS [Bacillaceae bacterium]MDR9795858.1 cysteine desulfurase family protein [Aeribacillus pallidus]MED0715596.1 cysteine desulfurase family protein [Aeribacillus composti]MED0745877.1 cysteine desulfurase family protein [Aeribacillus composti]